MNKALAELKYKNFKRQFGEMTYREIVDLGFQAEQFLNDMTPCDPAYEHFSKQKYDFFRYAEVCDAVLGIGGKDHVIQKKYLIADSKGNCDELEVSIPRYTSKYDYLKFVKEYYESLQRSKGIEYNYKEVNKIEILEI